MDASPSAQARERLVPLEGTQNFRDLGGYATADGGRIRWGRLYRADALSTLTSGDLAYLEAIGLRLVIDFRGDEEVALEPGPLRARAGVHVHHAPIGENASPSQWRARFEGGDLGDLDAGWLSRTYVGMLDGRPEVFADVIRTLAAEGALPAVFHCTAGKDRTGVMAMLVLRWLGVSREDVVADYALTARYTGGRIRAASRWFGEIGIDGEASAHLFTARPESMGAALDHLDARYGGIDRYAEGAMGLDGSVRDALRAALVER